MLSAAFRAQQSPFFARHFATIAPSAQRPMAVCIVGAGPSGFYSAKYLMQHLEHVQVDMYDVLPTPYGLVRSGVAPDHQDVKLVVHDFKAIAEDRRYNFYGNVKLGKDLTIDDLKKHYAAVILAYGAEGEKTLGIDGEQLNGVFPARAFVNWYNGHPNFKDLVKPEDLNCETAVVIGQGNVAVDIARMFSAPTAELAKSDIAEHALSMIDACPVKKVYMIGRRGPVQAAFTIKELRELSQLDDCLCVIPKSDMSDGLNAASLQEAEENRGVKRKVDLMKKIAEAPSTSAKKELIIKFFGMPQKIYEDPAKPGRAGSLEIEKSKLVGDAAKQKAKPTGEKYVISAGLIVESIGYKSLPIAGIPFDDWNAVVPNKAGRVLEAADSDKACKGMYVTGWLKRGPTGIVGTNIPDAKETVAAVVEDVQSGLVQFDSEMGGFAALKKKLDASGVVVVDNAGWAKIDAEEIARGQKVGKPREKIVSIDEMLKIARS